MSWSIIGERVIGAAHIRNHKPCQDALRNCELEGIGVISILADGHGSEKCKYSDEGAEMAVTAALFILKDIIARHTKDELYFALRHIKDVILPKNIEREWKQRVSAFHKLKEREPAELKELYKLYGTTLMILFVTDQFIFAMQIGDGDILSVFEGGDTSWLIEADVQYGTETYSLCLNESWKYFKNKLIPLSQQTVLPKLFLASTDGYANSFVSSEEFLKIGKDYLEIIKQNKAEYIKNNLSEWLAEASACGSGDDITFVLIYDCKLDQCFGG